MPLTTLTVRFDPEQVAALHTLAEEEQRSIGQIVRFAIKRYLADEGAAVLREQS